MALAVLVFVTVTGCLVAHAVPEASVLRVGTSGDYNPFSFRNAAGVLTGFDIAVAQRLANDLGRRIEFVPFRWPELVAQLRAGGFDIAMSGVTVRPNRAVYLAFTRPYAVSGAVAVIRAGDRQRFPGLDDLDHPNVRLAVNSGGHLEQVARKRFPHAHLLPVGRNAALPQLLLRGGADAVLSDEFEARTWPRKRLALLGPFTRDRKAYALPRESTELLRQVDDWLAAREADGWLNEQRRRWLGQRAVVSPQQSAFEALVAAIDLRLQLMPFVAAVKRREHVPIEDPAQEARVLERVRNAAAAAGLNADDVAALFRLQMGAAKAIEEQVLHALAPSAVDLSLSDLRAAVAGVSDQVIAELARCQPWLHDPAWHNQLDRAVRAGLTTAAVPESMSGQLVEALQRMRSAAP